MTSRSCVAGSARQKNPVEGRWLRHRQSASRSSTGVNRKRRSLSRRPRGPWPAKNKSPRYPRPPGLIREIAQRPRRISMYFRVAARLDHIKGCLLEHLGDGGLQSLAGLVSAANVLVARITDHECERAFPRQGGLIGKAKPPKKAVTKAASRRHRCPRIPIAKS